MCSGGDVDEVVELKRQGLNIRGISRLTGYDRKTINRYLSEPSSRPVFEPRAPALSGFTE
jgi:transposase